MLTTRSDRATRPLGGIPALDLCRDNRLQLFTVCIPVPFRLKRTRKSLDQTICQFKLFRGHASEVSLVFFVPAHLGSKIHGLCNNVPFAGAQNDNVLSTVPRKPGHGNKVAHL
jgi:hypothetical protein